MALPRVSSACQQATTSTRAPVRARSTAAIRSRSASGNAPGRSFSVMPHDRRDASTDPHQDPGSVRVIGVA